jgi:2-keto-4-pentenoate hydratase
LLATALFTAWSTHTPTSATGLTDLSTAYDVQRAFVDLRAQHLDPTTNGRVAGYKVALTSPEAQHALQADEPASGILLVSDIRPSGSQEPLDRLFSPLLEVELIFRVVTELPAEPNLDDVLAATEVAAGLECPDGRYEHWFGGDFPALCRQDVIADDCLAGLVVVGDTWTPAADLDLPSTSAQLRHQGELIATGPATDVLGHPASSVVWLAGHLAARGHQLTPGAIVSSGTYTAPLRAKRGTVAATFSHGIGDVSITFN